MTLVCPIWEMLSLITWLEWWQLWFSTVKLLFFPLEFVSNLSGELRSLLNEIKLAFWNTDSISLVFLICSCWVKIFSRSSVPYSGSWKPLHKNASKSFISLTNTEYCICQAPQRIKWNTVSSNTIKCGMWYTPFREGLWT